MAALAASPVWENQKVEVASKHGEIVQAALRFTNFTEPSLTVVGCRASCACTEVRIVKDVVKVGEVGLIELSIRPPAKVSAEMMMIAIRYRTPTSNGILTDTVTVKVSRNN